MESTWRTDSNQRQYLNILDKFSDRCVDMYLCYAGNNIQRSFDINVSFMSRSAQASFKHYGRRSISVFSSPPFAAPCLPLSRSEGVE